jgi:hypothetical protein
MEKDKKLHVALGAIVAFAAGLWTHDPMTGFLVGISAGLVKDIVWDSLLEKGEFDALDIAWTIIGSAFGGALVLTFFFIF